MKKKILLYGIGTYKNKGVEAIIQSTIDQINTKEYDISAATHDIKYNNKFYNNKISKYIKHYKKSEELSEKEKKLETEYKNIPFDYNNFELLYQNEVVKELEKSDICISVGGDNYCYDFCTWLYALDKKAKDSNKKTILWGASLFSEIEDLELINNLNNFDLLVIRESLSYNAVKKYIPEEKILFVKDPAFSLKIKEIKLNEWYKNRNYIVLNLSPLTIKDTSKESIQYKAIIDLMDYILEKTKYSICLLPHVTTEDCNDLTILEKLYNKYKKNEKVYLETNDYNCNELKYIISKAKILVAARTHASIAAYSTGVPTLVIGYSVKAKGIAKDLFGNYENYVIDSKKINSKDLLEKFKFIDNNKQEIINTLNKQLPEIKEETSHIFENVIKKLEEQEKSKICSKKDCIGCGICQTKCPKNAISMEENNDGYIYPKIDLKKCIECNLCRKSCPINNTIEQNNKKKKEYYAAKNKDLEERKKSTSGGIFSVLSTEVLKKQGIVYGCEMKDFEANHVRITKLNDLNRIIGSKYIQSNFKEILKELKKDLENKKLVLFSGTPCQIGAIKLFLQKDYENLITVSVICHGVLNSDILKKYKTSLEKKYNGSLEKFEFRTKDNGWTKSSIKYKILGDEKVETFTENLLMYGYLKDLLTRESCYNCKYKGEYNQADIILGDYWGIEVTNKEFFDQNGVSAVIINSEKGNKFLNKINFFDKVEYTKGNYKEIVKYNPSLISSIKRTNYRTLTSEYLKEYPLDITLKLLKNRITTEELEKRIRELEDANESLRNESLNFCNQLNSIYASKRWKITNKLSDIINELLGRKERK